MTLILPSFCSLGLSRTKELSEVWAEGIEAAIGDKQANMAVRPRSFSAHGKGLREFAERMATTGWLRCDPPFQQHRFIRLWSLWNEKISSCSVHTAFLIPFQNLEIKMNSSKRLLQGKGVRKTISHLLLGFWLVEAGVSCTINAVKMTERWKTSYSVSVTLT